MDQSSMTVPAITAMAPAVRRGVVGMLDGFDRRHDGALIAGELVASAIRAAAGDLVVRVCHLDDGAVRIEVRDQRGRQPQTSPAEPEDGAPDPLAVVSAVADRVGSSRRGGDCITWAVVAPNPTAS